jgi:hypothetical protein
MIMSFVLAFGVTWPAGATIAWADEPSSADLAAAQIEQSTNDEGADASADADALRMPWLPMSISG